MSGRFVFDEPGRFVTIGDVRVFASGLAVYRSDAYVVVTVQGPERNAASEITLSRLKGASDGH